MGKPTELQSQFDAGFELINKLQQVMNMLRESTNDIIQNLEKESQQVLSAKEQKIAEMEMRLMKLAEEKNLIENQKKQQTAELTATITSMEITHKDKQRKLKDEAVNKIQEMLQTAETCNAEMVTVQQESVELVLTKMKETLSTPEAMMCISEHVSEALKAANILLTKELLDVVTNHDQDQQQLSKHKITEFKSLAENVEKIKGLLSEKENDLRNTIQELQQTIVSERTQLESRKEVEVKMFTVMSQLSRKQIEETSKQKQDLDALKSCIDNLFTGFRHLKQNVNIQFGIFEEAFPSTCKDVTAEIQNDRTISVTSGSGDTTDIQHGGRISVTRDDSDDSDDDDSELLSMKTAIEKPAISLDDFLKNLKDQHSLWKFCLPYVYNCSQTSICSEVESVNDFVAFILNQEFFSKKFVNNNRVQWASFVENVMQFEMTERKCQAPSLMVEYVTEIANTLRDGKKRLERKKHALSENTENTENTERLKKQARLS